MASLCRAYKETRKLPFLKALTRIGTIAGAARACRISRDAVHDWRRNDESFERLFLQAKRRHTDTLDLNLETSLTFFESIVRRAVPREYWARMTAELAIAVTNLKNDLRAGDRKRVSASGNQAGFPLSPNRHLPEGFVDVAIPHRGNGNSAFTL